MNKTDLTNKVAEQAGLTKAEAAKAVNATLEAIATELKAGEKVALIGWGTFAPAVRPARTGKNPRTGEAVAIPEKKVVKFKAGSALEL